MDILKSSTSPERKLIDELNGKLSVDTLRQALETCQAQPGNNCVYVARTAYRFLPEFRDGGQIDELNKIFSSSRTKEYDLYLVNGYRDGQAHEGAIEFLARRRISNIGLDDPVIRSNFDVYLVENSLIYIKEQCIEDDTDAMFFLALYPVDADDLPIRRKQYGFDNLDFRFDHRGHRIGGICLAQIPLPEYAISKIETGQYVPVDGSFDHLWEGEFRVAEQRLRGR